MKVFKGTHLVDQIDNAIIGLQDLKHEVLRSLSDPKTAADVAYNQGYRLYLLNRSNGGKPPGAEMVLTQKEGEITLKGGDEEDHAVIKAFITKYHSTEDGEYWVVPLEPDEISTANEPKLPDGKVDEPEDDYQPMKLFVGSAVIYPTDHRVVEKIEPIAIVKVVDDKLDISIADSVSNDTTSQMVKYAIDISEEQILDHIVDEREYGIYVSETQGFADYIGDLVRVKFSDKFSIKDKPSGAYQTLAVLGPSGKVTFRMSDVQLIKNVPGDKPIFAIKAAIEQYLRNNKMKGKNKSTYFVMTKK